MPKSARREATAKESVVLPIPGSPPRSTDDPLVRPPPSTRSISSMPSMILSSSRSSSSMMTGRSRCLPALSSASIRISLMVSQPPHRGHFPIHLRVSWPHESHMKVDLLFILLMGLSAPSTGGAGWSLPSFETRLRSPINAGQPPPPAEPRPAWRVPRPPCLRDSLTLAYKRRAAHRPPQRCREPLCGCPGLPSFETRFARRAAGLSARKGRKSLVIEGPLLTVFRQ